MPQPSTAQGRGPEPGSREELHLRFESAEALREAYSQNLASGALFVPTRAAHAPRDRPQSGAKRAVPPWQWQKVQKVLYGQGQRRVARA